ncbi:hypothetical protein [Burkholderia stagnalis]|uniref:hypothetical protein n=1 Tax=Burkholderia stagnalis TaxID=1503054 RepID=UPI000ACCA53F|nr:hypothetical protein [Burkholderia stagnalis]
MESMKQRAAAWCGAAFMFAALAGCAPAIVAEDAHLVAPATGLPNRVVQQEAIIHLSTGFDRRIAAGTQWRFVGTLPQGRVFRAVNKVFAIVGRQEHEAYLVLDDNRLVGFYLPGVAHFSPLDPPVSLQLGDVR